MKHGIKNWKQTQTLEGKFAAAAAFFHALKVRAEHRFANHSKRPGKSLRVFDELGVKFIVSNEPLLSITQVNALPDHILHLEFSNGCHQLISMRPYLGDAPYDQLTPAAFAQVQVRGGLISWPGGIEIAPEMLHDLAGSPRRLTVQ